MAHIPTLRELGAYLVRDRSSEFAAALDAKVANRAFDDFYREKAVTPPPTSAAMLLTPGQPVYRNRDLNSYVKYAYAGNVYYHRGVAIIADALAGIDWKVYKKGATGLRGQAQMGAELQSHALYDLLDNPSPLQSKSEFIAAAIAFWLFVRSRRLTCAREL